MRIGYSWRGVPSTEFKANQKTHRFSEPEHAHGDLDLQRRATVIVIETPESVVGFSPMLVLRCDSSDQSCQSLSAIIFLPLTTRCHELSQLWSVSLYLQTLVHLYTCYFFYTRFWEGGTLRWPEVRFGDRMQQTAFWRKRRAIGQTKHKTLPNLTSPIRATPTKSCQRLNMYTILLMYSIQKHYSKSLYTDL